MRWDCLQPGLNIRKSGLNRNIGSFDTETFTNDDGKSKIYSLGFSNNELNKNKKQSKMYYLGVDGFTSD